METYALILINLCKHAPQSLTYNLICRMITYWTLNPLFLLKIYFHEANWTYGTLFAKNHLEMTSFSTNSGTYVLYFIEIMLFGQNSGSSVRK